MPNADIFEPESEMVQLVGPFSKTFYRISVEGYRVPYITAHLKQGTEDVWTLLLDDRFAIEVTDAEVKKFMWFIFNAMAVAAGRTCFGEHGRSYADSQFDCKLAQLGEDDV